MSARLATRTVAGALAACGGSGTRSGETPVTCDDLLVPPLLASSTRRPMRPSRSCTTATWWTMKTAGSWGSSRST